MVAEVGLAEQDDGTRPVTEADPTALWTAVENAYTCGWTPGNPAGIGSAAP